MAPPPLRVFINYRRDDTGAVAQLLYDRLASRFGAENVFMDVRSLQPGTKWLEEIKSHIAPGVLFLSLIGPRWLSDMQTHEQEAVVQPAEDYIRSEIQYALRPNSGIYVIPVLVGDEVPFPAAETLPLSLRALTDLQHAQVRQTYFEEDVAALIGRIELIANTGQTPPVRPTLLPGATADTVPEPGNGRVRAADQLGITADVEMLVSVLLATDTPLPLAVGLFGDWGSGKSFFMALMQERIGELSRLAAQGKPEAEPFCRQVRQVRFNAWHYVDANLWASLAATLFDELALVDAPRETQTKLTELDEARKNAAEAREKRQELEDDVANLAAATDRPTAALRVSAPVAIHAVRDDPQLLSKLQNAAQDGIATDYSTMQLVNALGEIDTAAGKTGAAWRLFQEEVLHRRRWTTLVTLIVIVGVVVLASVVASWPAGLRALTLVGAVAAGLIPALSGTLRVLYLAREAREARELPLAEKRDQLVRAQAKEADAERKVAQRQREFAELRDKGLQLQQFVRERAASSDYRGKLGVVSQIRRDFEQLVNLLPSGHPIRAEQSVAVVATVKQHVPEVERIVLFVDDLDRCPHDKVVEVLQAVHLLLAFKLFVVVVGVDSRWLERSLRAHYQNLLEEPGSYLEKIFQIPFMLRQMTPGRYRALIDGLTAPPRQTGERSELARQAELANTGPSHGTGSTEGSPEGEVSPAEPPPLPRPQSLLISDAERELLGAVGGIVPTPRAAKRLVNTYRMLRVSVQDDELETFLPSGGSEYQAVILLLGVLVGCPSRAQEIFEKLETAADADDVWEALAEFTDVSELLATVRSYIKVTQAGPYRRWAPRVSRFSFRFSGDSHRE
jgi:hypothetical protein